MKSPRTPEKRRPTAKYVATSVAAVATAGTLGFYASKTYQNRNEQATAPLAPGNRHTGLFTSSSEPMPELSPAPSPTTTEVKGCLPSPKQDLLKADIGKIVSKAVASINAPHGKADASKVRRTEHGDNLVRRIGDAKVALNVNTDSINDQVKSVGVGYWPTTSNEAPTVSILATMATATSPSQIEVTGQIASPYDSTDVIPVDNVLCADGSVYNQAAGGFTAQANAETAHKWAKDIALVFSAAEAPGGVRTSPDLSMLPKALRS